MHDPVSFEEMRGHLLTLEDVRGQLAATEPLIQSTFFPSDDVEFTVPPAWAGAGDDDDCGAVLKTRDDDFTLSKISLLEAGAAVGIPRKLQERMPARILQDALHWWFRGGAGGKEFKVLASRSPDLDRPLARAMCRGTVVPFSNLALLDIATERIRARYGDDAEILADYKFHHDLELTSLRLIIPGHARVISGTRVADDTWCAGIDMRNSLIGLKPTDFAGYLFRYWCTNGETDTLNSTGKFSRREKHTEADVWDWARMAVDEVLGGLDASFDSVQMLTSIPVDGNVQVVLDDLFARYEIPKRECIRVKADLAVAEDDLTMYDIQEAVTRAANADGLPPRAVSNLLTMGGHIAHAATGRCSACQRLLPEGYVPPEPAHAV